MQMKQEIGDSEVFREVDKKEPTTCEIIYLDDYR